MLIDATTRIQYWIESSALHTAGVSKKHCLEFFDLMAFVSEHCWSHNSSDKVSDEALLVDWLTEENGWIEEDIVTVLQRKYKWAYQTHNTLFYDEKQINFLSSHGFIRLTLYNDLVS
jgi:hypothetical protein